MGLPVSVLTEGFFVASYKYTTVRAGSVLKLTVSTSGPRAAVV